MPLESLLAQAHGKRIDMRCQRALWAVPQRPQLDFGLFHLILHEGGMSTMEEK
jgi:hypothetical protein